MLNTINPTDGPRVLVEMTSSFSPAMQFTLPPAQVVTNSAMPLKAIGRGSARLYSERITPVELENKVTVFGIDMGVDGRQNRASEGKIVLDPRWLTTVVRDILACFREALSRLKTSDDGQSVSRGPCE